MRVLLVALFAILTFPVLAKDYPAIIGHATVVDADTIEIHDQRIRIWGIDAPETKQLCKDSSGKDYRCGQKASLALDEWLNQSQPVKCEPNSKDRYKRFVAKCFRADGEDIAVFLVLNGHALDWPRYSKGFYEKFQKQASRSKTGIWQGPFTVPWEWRKNKKQARF